MSRSQRWAAACVVVWLGEEEPRGCRAMLPISEGCPEEEREGGCCTGWVSQAADSEKSLQTGCLLRSVPGTFPGGGRGEEGNRIGQRGKVSLADPTGTQDHGDLHSRVPLERADQAFIPAPLDTATVG